MPIVDPQKVFKIDGVHPVDFFGRSIFPMGISWTPEENFYEEDVLTGSAYQVNRLTARAGVIGPTGLHRHTWMVRGVADNTGWDTLRRISVSGTVHNAAIPIIDTVKIDTDGTTLVYDTYREALGNTYGAVLGMGVNSGVAAAYVDNLAIYNRLTGVTYTKVWNVPPAAPTEVRLDNTGAGAFRTLTFFAAPADGVDVIRVEGLFMYVVSFKLTQLDLGQEVNGSYEIPYEIRMRELGS